MTSRTPWRTLGAIAAGALVFVGACAHRDAAAPPSSSPDKNAVSADRAADHGPPPPPASPPATAASEYERPRDAQEAQKSSSTPTGGTSQPAPSPPAPAAEPPADAPRKREAAVRAARGELERAQRELDLAMSDCMSACRALGSMERATGHLCDLASEQDDRHRCEDAKTAVQRARDKIRGRCGTCPGGPSLEKSAPIPSRP